MDPASLVGEILDDPLQEDEAMEWYHVLVVMVIWDIIRSVFTAWLTKWWISRKKTRSNNERKD